MKANMTYIKTVEDFSQAGTESNLWVLEGKRKAVNIVKTTSEIF
jgi:hypothetical protein